MQENIDSCAKTLNLFNPAAVGVLSFIQLCFSGLDQRLRSDCSAKPFWASISKLLKRVGLIEEMLLPCC